MKRAIIIANGAEDDYAFYKQRIKDDDFIICADGAIRHCINMGITPDLWVGDFDSCDFDDILNKNPNLNNCEILKLNPDKDETDTHRSIMVALKRGFKEIYIWCACGNRADHMLSNIHILEFLNNNNCCGFIEDSKNTITLIDKDIVFTKERKYISLIPLDKEVHIEKTEGLKYNLENYIMPRCLSIGVSNEFISDSCYIKLLAGLLVVIQSDD